MKYLFLLAVPALIFGHGGEKHEEKKVEVSHDKMEMKVESKEVFSEINNEYLKNIKPIFEVKCFDCHSDKTNYPWYFKLPLVSTMIQKDIDEAKEHLDFSNDYPFISHDTPIKDLRSILKVFEEKSMPPFKYTIMHSESKILDEDIQKVRIWVEESLKKLEDKW